MHARVWQHPHGKAPRGTVRTILEIYLERSERLLMSDHLRREIRLVQISGFARSQRVEFLLMLQNERSRDRHIVAPGAFASGVSARRGPAAYPKACRIYSASYPAALKKFRHSVTEKSVMMSPSALVIVSKLRAARFRRSDLSFENAISMGFRSGE